MNSTKSSSYHSLSQKSSNSSLYNDRRCSIKVWRKRWQKQQQRQQQQQQNQNNICGSSLRRSLFGSCGSIRSLRQGRGASRKSSLFGSGGSNHSLRLSFLRRNSTKGGRGSNNSLASYSTFHSSASCGSSSSACSSLHKSGHQEHLSSVRYNYTYESDLEEDDDEDFESDYICDDDDKEVINTKDKKQSQQQPRQYSMPLKTAVVVSDDDDDDVDEMKDEKVVTIDTIQRMNNVCAASIEFGKFDKAITKLAEAVKLLGDVVEDEDDDDNDEQDQDQEEEKKREDDDFIDDCFRRSKEYFSYANLSEGSVSKFFFGGSIRGGSRSRGSSRKSKNLQKTTTIKDSATAKNDVTPQPPKLHKTPVRVTTEMISRPSKNDLFLIVTFNLSLAYHLKLIKMSKSSISTRRDANGNSRFDKLVQSTIRLYDLLPKAMKEEEDEDKEEEGGKKINPMFQLIVQSNLEHLKSIRPAAAGSRTTSKMHQLLGPLLHHHPTTTTMKTASFSKRKSVSSSSSSNNHNATFDLASVNQKQRRQPLLLQSASKLLVPSKSLYEQHKALLQQRYATTSNAATTTTTSSVFPSSSTEFQDHQKEQEEQQAPPAVNSTKTNNNGVTATIDNDNVSLTHSADFSTTSSPSKEMEKYIGFTSKLQEAIRTSSSFLHLQRDTRNAYAA